MQSFKKIGIKLYEELCSRGTTVYILRVKNDYVYNVEKVIKTIDLTIMSNSYAHPHTMKSAHEVPLSIY